MEGLLHPVSRIRKPTLRRGRDRRIKDGEEESLLEACDASLSKCLRPIVRLALVTAMRQGELVGLAWADIDFERRSAILHETKNGTTRSVPLSSAALAVLRPMALASSCNGQIFDIEVGRAGCSEVF